MIAALPLSGLILVVLFLILILLKSNKERSDLFLSLFLLFIGAELIYRYLLFSGRETETSWLIGLDLVYWILLGPAIWFYTLFVIHKDRPFHASMLFHLIPLGLVLIPYFQYLLTRQENTNFFHFTGTYPVYKWLISIGWEFCIFFYLIATIIVLIRYQRRLPGFFSSLKRKQLNWLLYLTAGFLGYLIMAFGIAILVHFRVLFGPGEGMYLIVVILVGYVLGMGVFGYRQQGVFSGNLPQEISNRDLSHTFRSTSSRTFNKYEKSGFHDEEQTTLIEALEKRMREGKPYLDPELNLQHLASQLNTTIHKLSQVINERFHQNFYEFINGYRIGEVQQKLRDTRYNHLKVMAIAYDCGFNSKSAFYSSFKKIAGITPVEYRRKYQPEREPIFVN